jgi:hypothetical protein
MTPKRHRDPNQLGGGNAYAATIRATAVAV